MKDELRMKRDMDAVRQVGGLIRGAESEAAGPW